MRSTALSRLQLLEYNTKMKLLEHCTRASETLRNKSLEDIILSLNFFIKMRYISEFRIGTIYYRTSNLNPPVIFAFFGLFINELLC